MSIDGTYNVVTKSAIGEGNATFTFKTTDGALEGTIEYMGDTLSLENGQLDGNEFKGIVEGAGPAGLMKMKLSGCIEGDAISGKLEAGFFKFKYTGERVS